MGFFLRNRQFISKIYMKEQRPKTSQDTLKERNMVREFFLPESKTLKKIRQ